MPITRSAAVPQYTAAQLPASAQPGAAVWVSDALHNRGSGALAWWNGSEWRTREGIVATASVRDYLIDLLRSGATRRGTHEWVEFDDHMSGQGGDLAVQSQVTGSGSASSISGAITAGRLGIFGLDTGTTTTGRAGTAYSHRQAAIGSDSWLLATGLSLTTLSDASEEYSFRFGLDPNVDSTYPTQGIFLTYDRAGANVAASTKWVAVTRASSAQTETDTGVTVATGYNNLAIYIPADRSEVRFYINGTLVATNTTNIPPASGGMGIRHVLIKSAGTTARSVQIDWRFEGIRRGTPITVF